MPRLRSRGSEVPQRPSPRGPNPLRTSSSDADPLRHRPITERSPKLGDRRSPRGSQSEPINPKKLGTRIADLESHLGQAQEELRILKQQLASAEAAKKEAQERLEKKTKKPNILQATEISKKHSPKGSQESSQTDNNLTGDDNQLETDVFEVPVEKLTVESKIETSQLTEEGNKGSKLNSVSSEPPAVLEPGKSLFQDLAEKTDEINKLKNKLEEKEKEIEVFGQENESLRNQLKEAELSISSAQVKEEEMIRKLDQLGEELEMSKLNSAELNEHLKVVEGAKEALEVEMKKIRTQTEQWRKAADAAASVLASGVDMNGKFSERCGSMDKHFANSAFETTAGGYAGFVGSPSADEFDNGFGNAKRKGSGIRMFGDLWKKKGHK